jgi:hypothetical protein
MDVSGQLLTLAVLPPLYPLDKRLGGPQYRSGRYGEEINLWPLPGIEPRPSEKRVVGYNTHTYIGLYNLLWFILRRCQYVDSIASMEGGLVK